MQYDFRSYCSWLICFNQTVVIGFIQTIVNGLKIMFWFVWIRFKLNIRKIVKVFILEICFAIGKIDPDVGGLRISR